MCIRDSPRVQTAKVYVLMGDLTGADLKKIKSYLINPVAVSYTHLSS